MTSHQVLIVGAGLSGLTAARRLIDDELGVNPASIKIIDKGRGVGGRLATRRIAGATLDHGAQFFTVRSEELQRDVDGWLASGVVEEWCRGFATVDGYPRYRARGGMKELARHLATELTEAGVDIVTDHRIEALVAATDDGQPWTATYEDGADPTTAQAIIATPPIPQTLALLAKGDTALEPEQAARLSNFVYHRVIALLTVLDGPSGLPEPGALQQPSDPVFSFVADNQAKGVSAEPAVTFHTAHQRSAELWPSVDDEVANALLPMAAELVAPASITEFNVKRWLYSGPVEAFPEPCLTAKLLDRGASHGPLVLAGDGFGGSKVEGAFLSGRAAAEAITGA